MVKQALCSKARVVVRHGRRLARRCWKQQVSSSFSYGMIIGFSVDLLGPRFISGISFSHLQI